MIHRHLQVSGKRSFFLFAAIDYGAGPTVMSTETSSLQRLK